MNRLIIAGPGTGKTYYLSRVARKLKGNILAIIPRMCLNIPIIPLEYSIIPIIPLEYSNYSMYVLEYSILFHYSIGIFHCIGVCRWNIPLYRGVSLEYSIIPLEYSMYVSEYSILFQLFHEA